MLAIALYVTLSNLAVSNSQWPSYTKTISFWISFFLGRKKISLQNIATVSRKVVRGNECHWVQSHMFWMIQVVSGQKESPHIGIMNGKCQLTFKLKTKHNYIVYFLPIHKRQLNKCAAVLPVWRLSILMNDCQRFPHINLQNDIAGTIAASSREISRCLCVSVWIFVGKKSCPSCFALGL